jgi:hypothetical protein
MFNSTTEIAGLFREQILPGAFADAVNRDDVRAQHRVWFRSARALFVRGMQNEDERDVTLVLLCEERADV